MAIRKSPDKKPRTSQRSTAKRKLTIWEKIEALGKEIPPEELARHPRDGARNLHHYLDGGPKQDPE